MYIPCADERSADARRMGAREAVLWSDTEAMKRLANHFDLLIATVPKSFPMQPFMDLLKLDATLVNVGAVELAHPRGRLELVRDCLVTAGSLLARCSPFGFAFHNSLMNTPNRTTAAAFPRYAADAPLADSASFQWKGLFVRRYRFPRVVDRFLVPATPEPLISCGLAGSAEFQEREVGGPWLTRQIGPGDLFVTRSKMPYEVRFSSPIGEEIDIVQVHIAVDQFLAALEAAYPGKTEEVEVNEILFRPTRQEL